MPRTKTPSPEETAQELEKLTARGKTSMLALTPAQVARLRAKVAAGVDGLIPQAIMAAAGMEEWTPTQARLFLGMLNKCIPDINMSYVQHDHTGKSVSELDRQTLEAIASGEIVIEEEAVDVTEEPKLEGNEQ